MNNKKQKPKQTKLHVSANINHRSHAECNICNEWKPIADQTWSTKQIENHRLLGVKLVCNMCQTNLKARGSTAKDQTLYGCAACGEEKGKKGRAAFSKGLLDEKRRTPTVTLVCLDCRKREKELVMKLKSPKAFKCTKNCKTDWPHVEGCQLHMRWHGYPLVSREDLKWLQFREKNRKFH